MSSYLELLKTPGVARIMASQLTARFPFGMLSLAVLMHVERVNGSFGAAGLVLASLSVGQALANPVSSRLIGRFGARTVIVTTTLLCASAITMMALFVMPTPAYMMLGLVIGSSVPPITPAVRTIYPRIVTGRQLQPLFSLDASTQEIIWIAGPVVVTTIAATVSTVAALVFAALVLVAGGIWFLTTPELRSIGIPPSTGGFGRVLLRRPILLAVATSFMLIASFTALEVVIIAVFGHGGLEAGLVLAVFGLGSLIGGALLGHWPIGRWNLVLLMSIVFVFTCLASVSTAIWWLIPTLFLAGFGHAPATAVMFSMVSHTLSFSETAEAFGWLNTGSLVGSALGAGLAGVLIDINGIPGGFWVTGGFAALGVLLPLIARSWNPDLRSLVDRAPTTGVIPLR